MTTTTTPDDVPPPQATQRAEGPARAPGASRATDTEPRFEFEPERWTRTGAEFESTFASGAAPLFPLESVADGQSVLDGQSVPDGQAVADGQSQAVRSEVSGTEGPARAIGTPPWEAVSTQGSASRPVFEDGAAFEAGSRGVSGDSSKDASRGGFAGISGDRFGDHSGDSFWDTSGGGLSAPTATVFGGASLATGEAGEAGGRLPTGAAGQGAAGAWGENDPEPGAPAARDTSWFTDPAGPPEAPGLARASVSVPAPGAAASVRRNTEAARVIEATEAARAIEAIEAAEAIEAVEAEAADVVGADAVDAAHFTAAAAAARVVEEAEAAQTRRIVGEAGGPGEAEGPDEAEKAAEARPVALDAPAAGSTAGREDGDWAFADRPGGDDELVGALAGASTARRSPLIVGEGTHEIPVHLLFRDEVDPTVRRRPTVVGRRLGTGEQPRIRRTGAPTRPEPPLDPKFNERPGPVLPGWAAAFAGGLTLVGCLALLWRAGALPDLLTGLVGLAPYPYHGIGLGDWVLLTLGVIVLLFTLGGLSRGRVGHALVLTLFGEYRGSVRRTGLLWISPLLLRRRVDVRLRHWRSEPMPAMDANGTALRVVVLVVWRVRDTVRATLGIRDHEEYLREQVEAAMARVMSQLPADAFQGASPTLRNVEAVGDSLTRVLSTECRHAGIEVFSAQPTRIEYAPEIADVMRRSRIAALDARHRDTVLNAVVDAVDDTVQRLTARGLVELDDYDRKALVKDLTVAFYTGRAGAPGERL